MADHHHHRISALIVAAGTGQRFGANIPKQFLILGGKAVLRHTLETFVRHPNIGTVCVVYHPDWEQATRMLITDMPDVILVPGGDSRQQSVLFGLEALDRFGNTRQILIHDGVRPLVDSGLISDIIAGLAENMAVIPGLQIADTLKQTRTDARHTEIVRTVNRQDYAKIQTPQGFDFDFILDAHRRCRDMILTDDAAVIEQIGGTVTLIPGSARNIKITRAEDLAFATLMIQQSELVTIPDIRVGTGFDVHQLVPGDGVIICGHKIECAWKLDGHSDADVGLHALCDALFGALANGDIGQHFPPSDPKWRGADSARFLHHALGLITARGGKLNHIDITIICELPKIGPHRATMTERLASLTGLTPDRIGIKATTTERLGFTGRGEGIAAQACATIIFPGS